MPAPRVFISYSREGQAHEEWVLGLAQKLRLNGVDATLDQWDLKPGADVPLFMESSIRDSDFVLLVCTPTYREKSNIPKGGVGYEKNIISVELLQSKGIRPKFIPVLRSGDIDTALPTYLGSKYAVDLRVSQDEEKALTELLSAIHGAQPSSKPPLGPNPFLQTKHGTPVGPEGSATAEPRIEVSGNVEAWAQRVKGRFDFLRQDRIAPPKADPFGRGYWQASFALQGQLHDLSLPELRARLQAAVTGRTGWNIGWVPSREGIAPYPFQDGVEVWLAEDGDKGAAHSDFWRAERIGTFAVFRGYQEDEPDFSERFPGIGLDYSLMSWRIAEVLLYLESFAKQLSIGHASANGSFRWTGLRGRRLGAHKHGIAEKDGVCRQEMVEVGYRIADTSAIKQHLIRHVQEILEPLAAAFDFATIDESEVRELIRGLFDPEKEAL